MALSARAITGAAAHRAESRGAHFRADMPETDSGLDGRHTIFDGTWRFGSLTAAIRPSNAKAPIG